MVDWNREAKRYQHRQAQQTNKYKKHSGSSQQGTPAHVRRRLQQINRPEDTTDSASARLHAQLDHLDGKSQRPRQHKDSRQRAARAANRKQPSSTQSHQTQVQKRKQAAQSVSTQHTQTTRHFSKEMVGYLLLFVAIGIVFALWASPLSRLSELAVGGNQMVSAETVINDSGLHPRMSLLDTMTSNREVNRALQTKHSNIKNARLEREERKVTIQVQEYRPVAKAYINGKLYPVFENQKVLAIDAKAYMAKLPLLESFANGQVERLAEALPKIPEAIRTKIKRITNIEDKNHPNRIALEMNDGNIVVGSIDHFAQRLGYYPNILKELKGETGLIDMEVGVYYEPLTPLNNPYATSEERETYQKQIAPTQAAADTSEAEENKSSDSASDAIQDRTPTDVENHTDTVTPGVTTSDNTADTTESSENLQ